MKRKLFEHLRTISSSIPEIRKRKGLRLLEIGAGTGANFEFYPPNTSLVVVDPNPFFKPFLLENLQKFPNVGLERCVVSGAEDMKDIPDNSVDVVVSTLVLCSVPDVQKVYKEICRVLVPGGKFLFMEHVIDDKLSFIKVIQILAGSLGIFQFCFDGCRPDKDIPTEIKKAGFAAVDAKRFPLDLKDGVPKGMWAVYVSQPHYSGVATTAPE
jgi:SAM-dependent methyltransferase